MPSSVTRTCPAWPPLITAVFCAPAALVVGAHVDHARKVLDEGLEVPAADGRFLNLFQIHVCCMIRGFGSHARRSAFTSMEVLTSPTLSLHGMNIDLLQRSDGNCILDVCLEPCVSYSEVVIRRGTGPGK